MIFVLIVSNVITLCFIIICAWKHAMSASRQRTFQRLIEHANVGYYRARSRDGAILAANESFLRILELSPNLANIMGRSLNELFIRLDEKESMWGQLKRKHVLKNYEYNFRTLNGNDKYVLYNAYLTKDPYTKEEIVEALVEDVTEERLSYERMKASQERYETLFKSSGDMVIIYRLDNFSIEEANPIVEVITGFSLDELVKSSFERLIHPAERGGLIAAREDLLFRGSAKLSTVMVTKDGSYRDVIMTMSVVEIASYNIAMAVIKDISELARERAEGKRREKELEEICRAAGQREERIRDLRVSLDKKEQQINLLKEKYEKK